MKADVIVLPSGEWYAFPVRDSRPSVPEMRRLEQAQKARTPEDAGMTRIGDWMTTTWPEGSREAVYEL